MTSFIEMAACKGRYPQGFSALQRRARSDLVARLLRQRRVARFIVAPDGYGKSYLAYEYANVVFSFFHVFWISGKSPCFLRDIDANSMFEEITRIDRDRCLVVFEDLPRLDHDRALLFSKLVDNLLNSGKEVLITCAPSCDFYEELHRDRMVLDGRDLMLDAEEARASFVEEANGKGESQQCIPAELIPCLRWDDEGEQCLMAGIKREELTGEELLALFSLLLLQRGRISDMGAFSESGVPPDLLDRLSSRYPFLGIDLSEGTYEAARISMPALTIAFGDQLNYLAQLSPFETREVFALRCADALMVRRLGDRAVSFMLAFATKRCAAGWLSSRGWDLLVSVHPKPVVDAYAQVERSVVKRRITLYAILSWAFYLLDNEEEARAFASKAAFSLSGEDSARAVGCIVLMRLGAEGEVARARTTLEKLLLANELGMTVATHETNSEEDHAIAAVWPTVASLVLAFNANLSQGTRDLSKLIERFECEKPGDEEYTMRQHFLLSACSWVLDSVAADYVRVGVPGDMPWALEADLPVSFVEARDFDRILRFACSAVEYATLVKGEVNWFEMRAASAFEGAFEHDPLAVKRVPSYAAMTIIRRAQLELFAQRDAYRKEGIVLVTRSIPLLESSVQEPVKELLPASKDVVVRTLPPMLRVNLFGGFEVRIGEEVLDPQLFTRHKMRTLLAILVLNRGREFSRERLAEMLWPMSTERSAKKSFYSLWSRLCSTLQVNGTCPYLIRDQAGCRLNSRFVSSDVQQFEELCRMLMFGRTDERGWEHVYTQVSVDYAEPLLPCETSNDMILAMRAHYHTQLVDALIAASSRMVVSGEIRGALWFAREALRRDRSREDAYVAQMEAQIAAEQRVAALDTFFACRRFLANELGIDPSPRIVNLYRAIIESEEMLD